MLRWYLRAADALDSRRLWNVLVALRGPDSGNYSLKDATTAVIRRKALGNVQAMYGCVVGSDSPELAKYRNTVLGESHHFLKHAEEAFFALDMSWNGKDEGGTVEFPKYQLSTPVTSMYDMLAPIKMSIPALDSVADVGGTTVFPVPAKVTGKRATNAPSKYKAKKVKKSKARR